MNLKSFLISFLMTRGQQQRPSSGGNRAGAIPAQGRAALDEIILDSSENTGIFIVPNMKLCIVPIKKLYHTIKLTNDKPKHRLNHQW